MSNCIKIFVVFMLISTSFVFGGELELFDANSNIVIKYNDVNVFRRSLESAPIIGSGKEDHIVKINCLGEGDCENRIKSIYSLISNRKPASKKCELPVYASVRIFYEVSAYSEVEKNREEIYKFDYSGDCLLFENKSYKLDRSIYHILTNNPLNKW